MNEALKKLIWLILSYVGYDDKLEYYLLKKLILRHRDTKLPLSYRERSLFFSYNSKILFIHIPKAAGMSVVHSLYGENKSHHAKAIDFIEQSEVKYRSAFSFTIVRNPYERLYSAYNYLKKGGMNVIDQVWRDIYVNKYNDFRSFVTEGGLQFAVSCSAEHFIPQHEFVFLDEIQLCDYIGYLEQQEEIERTISNQLGYKFVLSNKNTTLKNEYNFKKIYNDEMIAIVNEVYKDDFSLLGYKMM
ncbi:sulfotransferase family protein [Vibrio sp. JC009]|uniref:sulfotransferase family 2 domain-containing protein n=1 Tax=Vibrio sp. JC009 TaxID=2912314 RepID=UPI0023AE9233|nr:sulfotransferase family 2 domain-containing protein [Vibrio sp. JC009]WED20639.1 sulfotransferase family protein [Vibrio sp. JC009]